MAVNWTQLTGLTSSGLAEMWPELWGLLAALLVVTVVMAALTLDPHRPLQSLITGPVLGGYVFGLGLLLPLWFDGVYNRG